MTSTTNSREQPRESTPLLSAVDPGPNDSVQSLPNISSTLERIQFLQIEDLDFSDIYGPHDLSAPAAETAFALIVLLQWRINKIRESVYSQDVWDYWSKERDNSGVVGELETLIFSLWKAFVTNYRSTRDLQDVLWLEFPEKEGSLRCLRGASIFLSRYTFNLTVYLSLHSRGFLERL